MFPATGRVTLADGTPVAMGQVEFRHQDRGVSAIAYVDQNGNFALMTKTPGDGVYPGKYRAVLHAPPPPIGIPGNREADTRQAEARTRWLSLVPIRYQSAQTSDLEFVVTEDAEKNVFSLIIKP